MDRRHRILPVCILAALVTLLLVTTSALLNRSDPLQIPAGALGAAACLTIVGLCTLPQASDRVAEPTPSTYLPNADPQLLKFQVDPDILEEQEDAEAGWANDLSDDPDFKQSWQRFQRAGTDEIHGQLRVHLEAGERITHVHLPIIPAMSALPEVWCECDDERLNAEVTLQQKYGVRATIRCQSGVTSDISAVLTFAIIADAAQAKTPA